MLNPRWKSVYDKNDWNEWLKLDRTSPITSPSQHQALNRLLDKYFRTNAGGGLNPEEPRSTGQRMSILRKTMEELDKAVMADQEQESHQYEEQRLKDIDPEDIRIMQDELVRGSNMLISYREAANIMLDKEGTQRYEPNSAFDKNELKTGISDEKSEHANPNISSRENNEIATEITKDHLEKNPNYYTDMDKAGID